MAVLDVTLYSLSIPFAILTGSLAGVFAFLTWGIFRSSPFDLGVKLYAVVALLATIYHGALLVLGSETFLLQALLILGYTITLVTLFTFLLEFSRKDRAYETTKSFQLFVPIVGGLLIYSILGPFTELYFPSVLHWVHGFGALAVIGGLYIPVQNQLQNQPSAEFLPQGDEPEKADEWMRTIDETILQILVVSDLILTPAVVAYNIDYSRDEVNRRLRRLEEDGFVERVERGKYRVTDLGKRYLVRKRESS